MTTTPYKKLTYDDTKVQVESAIRDEDGVRFKTNYAKKTEIKDGVLTVQTNGGTSLGTFSANQSTNQTITLPSGTVQLLNQSVGFVSNPDTSTNEEFPYRATVTVSGVTTSTYAEVTYTEDQATSLNFATFCDTDNGKIYLYSRTNVGTVTIPTISIGMDYSDITIDATPTSGSGNAVSSGGVYTALSTKADTSTLDDYVTKGTAQTITATKTHKQPILLQADNTDPYIQIVSNYPRIGGKNPNNLASANGMVLQFVGYDARDKLIIQQDGYRRGESAQAEFHTYVRAENNVTGDFAVYAQDNGTCYMLGPYRTSGIGSTDVLTAGNGVTLNTTQTVTGAKSFPSQVLRIQTSIPSSSTASVGWGAGDILFTGQDGSQIGVLRLQQEGTGRSFFLGIFNASGTVYWTQLASHST